MNICKFYQNCERKPGGEEETLLKKFTKISNKSIFISDGIGCENVEIIRITRAKVEFGLRFKNRLVKDLLS